MMNYSTVARLAMTPANLIDAGIDRIVRMAMRTVGLNCITEAGDVRTEAANNIGLACYWFQVRRIYATAMKACRAALARFVNVVANVIQLKTVWNWANQKFVHRSVGFQAFTRPFAGGLPIAVSINCTCPNPATIRLLHMFPDSHRERNRRSSEWFSGAPFSSTSFEPFRICFVSLPISLCGLAPRLSLFVYRHHESQPKP